MPTTLEDFSGVVPPMTWSSIGGGGARAIKVSVTAEGADAFLFLDGVPWEITRPFINDLQYF